MCPVCRRFAAGMRDGSRAAGMRVRSRRGSRGCRVGVGGGGSTRGRSTRLRRSIVRPVGRCGCGQGTPKGSVSGLGMGSCCARSSNLTDAYAVAPTPQRLTVTDVAEITFVMAMVRAGATGRRPGRVPGTCWLSRSYSILAANDACLTCRDAVRAEFSYWLHGRRPGRHHGRALRILFGANEYHESDLPGRSCLHRAALRWRRPRSTWVPTRHADVTSG